MITLEDHAAEEDVVASLLLRPKVIPEVADIIPTPDYFVNLACRQIVEAIWNVRHRGEPVSVRSVEREAMRHPHALANLTAIIDGLVSRRPGAVMEQARRVRDVAMARRMRSILFDLADDPTSERDPVQWLDLAARRVTEAADVRSELELRPLADFVDEHIALMERREQGIQAGIAVGIDGLDRITGGLNLGEYTILAARPSCGKSALALQIANFIATGSPDRHPEPVAFFSSEMKRMSIIDRAVSDVGSLPMHGVRRGKLDDIERRALLDAYERLRRSGRHVHMSDRRGWRINEVVAQVRSWLRIVRRPRADGSMPRPVVIFDYLQRCRGVTRHSVREQEVAEVSDIVGTMAGELDVAALFLAQLKRPGVAKPADEWPSLEELRESGAIEQDADNVWLIHRPDRIDPLIETGAAGVFVAKQRNEVTGMVPLWFRGAHQRFEDRDRDYTRRGDNEPKPKRRAPRPKGNTHADTAAAPDTAADAHAG